jgi:hypothetical protein
VTLLEIGLVALRSGTRDNGWYLGAVIDRLPSAELHELAEQAVHRLVSGPNDAAQEIIAHVSLQQGQSLTSHLPTLWELRPNKTSYYANWPWRAADEAEIARLWKLLDTAGEPDRDRAPAMPPGNSTPRRAGPVAAGGK